MNYESLTNPETDGFPELVYALHDALTDLLGDQFDIDIDALAPELADTAWKQLRGADWFRALAQAWDEGSDAAYYDPEIRGFVAHGDNPYWVEVCD